MRRLFWVALGATAGVLIVRQVTKVARTMTPEGAANKATGAVNNLADAIREFKDDVSAGMAQRDHALREALGIADDDASGQGDPYAVDYLLRQQGDIR